MLWETNAKLKIIFVLKITKKVLRYITGVKLWKGIPKLATNILSFQEQGKSAKTWPCPSPIRPCPRGDAS